MDDTHAEILRSESAVNPDSFQYTYETSNGIAANEAGQLKQLSPEESAIITQGQFKYTSPEGITFIIIPYTIENKFIDRIWFLRNNIYNQLRC